MTPDNERGRPGREAASGDEQPGGGDVTTTVTDAADPWPTIRAGWVRAGDTIPRPGTVAYHLLAADDPVRIAAAAAAELGADTDLRRHGPSWARLLAEVTG